MSAVEFLKSFRSGVRSLTSDDIQKLHDKSDKDGSAQALHHTLGTGANQASPGNHNHRGGDSARLLEGITVTGSRDGNVALTNLLIVLREFGLNDSTSP